MLYCFMQAIQLHFAICSYVSQATLHFAPTVVICVDRAMTYLSNYKPVLLSNLFLLLAKDIAQVDFDRYASIPQSRHALALKKELQ